MLVILILKNTVSVSTFSNFKIHFFFEQKEFMIYKYQSNCASTCVGVSIRMPGMCAYPGTENVHQFTLCLDQ